VKGVKISTLIDDRGRPLSMVVSPANVHDSRLYPQTIDGFRIKISQGRPITRPTIIVADAAYGSNEIRIYNRKRGIKSNIAINKRNKKNQEDLKSSIKKFTREEVQLKNFSVE